MQQDIQNGINKIRDGHATIPDLEAILIQIYRLLDSEDESDYNLCLSAICYIADLEPTDKLIQQLLHDCIVKSRIFLYADLLDKRKNGYDPNISFQDSISKAFYTSGKTKTVLTKPQKEIFNLFQKYKKIVISAPTSFGKTRIVREIIAHNSYKHIALIMPTVSLLSEQFQEIRNNIDGYIISKSSKIEIDDTKRYILILTPERMSSFMEDNPSFKVDFFVMDEIYKTDFKLDDDRFRIFSDILYKLAISGSDFYLIGPYISDFSAKFRSKFNVNLRVFNIEIVQKEYFNFDSDTKTGKHVIEGNELNIVKDRFKNLLRVLTSESITGKFLIYRESKQLVEETATKLTTTWPVKKYNAELINYLSEIVSPDWNLVSCMKRGIAFHHGAMPRYIQDLIVDEFNSSGDDSLHYLFCTTSLTEGVNTSAKNVIVYDKKIGTSAMKNLDRKNIEGRAGRFMRHFIGRVFHFQNPDNVEDNTNVEIEYFDSDNPSLETLVQIEDVDLESSNLENKNSLKERLREINVPFELIKHNKFVNIDGQIKLIQQLRSFSDSDIQSLFFSNGIPNINIFKSIARLVYENLFSEHDKGGNFKNDKGRDILIQFTNYYLYYSPSFVELLSSDTAKYVRKNLNARIRYVFDLQSKYFEFVWPRYLRAFQEIYNFVASEKGINEVLSLDMVIAKLEYGTTETHEIILRDAGLPNQIVKKVSSLFAGCANFEEIQSRKRESSGQISNTINHIESRILDKYI